MKPPPPDPLASPVLSNVDLSQHGAIGPASGGMPPTSFAGASGPYLATLMRRLETPGAARWSNIVLGRALASRLQSPAGMNPADWVAERARLLMRLGQIDLAKRLIDPVPVDRYTPALYAASLDVSIAAGDLAAVCPLTITGQALSEANVWRLAGGICAAFEGDEATAARIFDTLRSNRSGIDSFDVSLAERIASEVGGTRSANIAWEEARALNLYRLGIANATGLEVPEALMAGAPAPMYALIFRAPAATESARMAAAPVAAAIGAASSADLVGFYGAMLNRADALGEAAAQLRGAYSAGGPDRLRALQALWGEEGPGRYPAYVLTAEAAMRLPVDKRFAKSAPELMMAALAGGRADLAARWWPLASAAGGETATRAWPLAVLSGAPGIEVTPETFAEWLDDERARVGQERADIRGRLLLAALSALSPGEAAGWRAQAAEIGIAPVSNRWTARIEAAAASGRRGEVALLAATGLQTKGWTSVPPEYLRYVLAAYSRVGLQTEARLLAAEAMSRT